MKSQSITGQFNWDGKERRSDRYGGIMLLGPHDSQFSDAVNVSLEPFRSFVGKHVTITAKVLEARPSYHVGDLARGIFPKTPKVGWVADLGTGTVRGLEVVGADKFDHLLFQRDAAGEDDWMDPNILYRLHHQTVELTIQEAEGAAAAPPQTKDATGFSASIIPIGESEEKPGWTDHQMKVKVDRE